MYKYEYRVNKEINFPREILTVLYDDSAVCRIVFGTVDEPLCYSPSALIIDVIIQLDRYFSGSKESFSLPLAPAATQFSGDVRKALCGIGYGQSVSYKDIAVALGKPTAVRAVGQANNKNPFPIIVPCHRVVGSDGSLTGYGGGLEIKSWLLDFERSNLEN